MAIQEKTRKDEPDTKLALLRAATRCFSERGYEGVSIRTLAGEVGANVAAIGYHFGGKEELYRACIEYVISEAAPRMGPARARLVAVLDRNEIPDGELAGEVARFVGEFIDALLGRGMPPGCHALVLREYAHPGIGFDLLYSKIMEPMHKLATALYARIHGLELEDPLAIIGAHSLLAQWLFFKMADKTALKRLGWDDYDEDGIAMVKSVVIPSVLRSLGLPHFETIPA